MNDHHGTFLFIALSLGLGLSACDQPTPPSPGASDASDTQFRVRIGIGTGSGLTLNTDAWASASARDIYEYALDGSWHDNGYGFSTKLLKVAISDSPYGAVTTDVGAQESGTQVNLKPGDDFMVEVRGPTPGEPIVQLSGADLIGLELTFRVMGFNDVKHRVSIRVTDHIEDSVAGDFYELVRIDSTTGETLAPVCNADSNGYRVARIFAGLTVDADTGEMANMGGGIRHIACTANAPAKAMLFGYDPIAMDPTNFTLVNRVVRADYCADGHPYTYPSNLVGIEDNFGPGQFGKTMTDVTNNLDPDEVLEAVWDQHGVLCIGEPRAAGVERQDILCPIKQLANGDVEYSWRPPSCATYVDDNPDGDPRIFSTTQQ